MKRQLIILLTLLTVSFFSCENEQVNVENTNINLRAELWFQNNHNNRLDNNPNFYGEPDWDNNFKINNSHYFPLIPVIKDGFKTNTNLRSYLQGSNEVYARSFLVLTENDNNEFTETLEVFVTRDNENFEINDDIIKKSSLKYNSNNQLFNYFSTEDISINIGYPNQDNNATASRDDGCQTIGVFLIITYDDGTENKILLHTYEECPPEISDEEEDGGGGGGAGDGDGSADDGPSCESFNFINTTSNWQEASVAGIRFNIVLINPTTLEIGINTIIFPQPIKFGLPSDYSLGGNLGGDSAAELSADILDLTMKEMAREFGRQQLTDAYIRVQFRERLIKNYRDYTGGGGRVQFNFTGLVPPPSPYKTKFFGTGDCD